jgi:hypothetical protein
MTRTQSAIDAVETGKYAMQTVEQGFTPADASITLIQEFHMTIIA